MVYELNLNKTTGRKDSIAGFYQSYQENVFLFQDVPCINSIPLLLLLLDSKSSVQQARSLDST